MEGGGSVVDRRASAMLEGSEEPESGEGEVREPEEVEESGAGEEIEEKVERSGDIEAPGIPEDLPEGLPPDMRDAIEKARPKSAVLIVESGVFEYVGEVDGLAGEEGKDVRNAKMPFVLRSAFRMREARNHQGEQVVAPHGPFDILIQSGNVRHMTPGEANAYMMWRLNSVGIQIPDPAQRQPPPHPFPKRHGIPSGRPPRRRR